MREVTAETLNDAVTWDSPFIVLPGSRIASVEIYAPSVTLYTDKEHNGVGDEVIDSKDWEPVTGYSGQQGYSGPCMHVSEFLGGGMARDVLANIGAVYSLASVECVPNWEVDQDDEDDVFLEAVTRDNPAGWMLLRLKTTAEDGITE